MMVWARHKPIPTPSLHREHSSPSPLSLPGCSPQPRGATRLPAPPPPPRGWSLDVPLDQLFAGILLQPGHGQRLDVGCSQSHWLAEDQEWVFVSPPSLVTVT